MDGYWYDYAKPKYGDKAKLSYTDMDNVIVHAKFEDVYAMRHQTMKVIVLYPQGKQKIDGTNEGRIE